MKYDAERIRFIREKLKGIQSPYPWHKGMAGNANIVYEYDFNILGVARVAKGGDHDFVEIAPVVVEYLLDVVEAQRAEIAALKNE